MPDRKTTPNKTKRGPLIYRQSLWTRTTHWVWAACLFFLLLSGLQVFNAHPTLYLGKQSGFEFNNAILDIGATQDELGLKGYTEILGWKFDTTGVLGVSGERLLAEPRAFPAWATLPSYRSLADGRVIHFFFAWLLSATLLVWLFASAWNGHLRRDLWPRIGDLKALPRDLRNHLRFRFHHTATYNVLQKLAYFAVLFVFLPLMIATGLAMSPGMDATLPWLTEVFAGRQTARTIHFVVMLALVGFFLIHMLMILAAGPFNELRSILTGWYRTDPAEKSAEASHGH